jgi:hypothetical protein
VAPRRDTRPLAMHADGTLILHSFLEVNAENGGFFVSRGRGTHPNRILPSYELIFVQQGALHLRENRTEYVVGKEEALVLWPNRRHAGTQPFPADLRFYWVHFTLKPTPPGLAGRSATRAWPSRRRCWSGSPTAWRRSSAGSSTTRTKATCRRCARRCT